MEVTDNKLVNRYITVDRAQGIQVGDNGKQINYITNIYQSSDYQALVKLVESARENHERYPADNIFIKKLRQAEQELENFIESLRKLIDEIDKIPLNTERGQKAKEYFESGNYQAARAILDEDEMTREKRALLKKDKEIKIDLNENKLKIDDLAAEFMLKARLAAVDYQMGDKRISTTRRYFEEALELNRTPQYLFDYAFFLEHEKKYKDALEILNEALPICKECAKTDSDTYLPGVAFILTNLGNIYQNLHLPENAKKYFRESLIVFDELNSQGINIYRVEEAGTRSNLGLILSDDLNHLTEAKTLLEEALKICREEYDKKKLIKALESAAGVINNLCRVLTLQDKILYFDAIELLVNEVLNIYNFLSENGINRHRQYEALVYNNFGTHVASDSKRDRLGEAEKHHHKALIIFRELSQNNPDVYLPEVGLTLRFLGNLITYQKGREKEAVAFLEEALAIYTKFAELNPHEYLADKANTIESLGSAYLLLDEPKIALQHFRSSQVIYEFLVQQNPQIFSERMRNNRASINNAINANRLLKKKKNQPSISINTKIINAVKTMCNS